MGLKIFVYGFFFTVFFVSFLSFDQSKSEIKKYEVPTVTFENSSLYSLDKEALKAIFVAKKVYKYEDRDEFFDAVYTTQNKQKNIFDTVSAKNSIYKNKILYCKKDVKINRNSNFLMTSEEVVYDTNSKVFESKTPFEAKYNGHFLKGQKLIAFGNSKILVDNPHFEIEVNK